MDSVSQFVLGASVGEVVLGKKLGNRALLWGGIAGTIPDLDVITRPFLSIVDEVAFHRSVSHSVLLFIFLAPALGYFLSRTSKFKETTFWEWTNLFFWGFLTHALLDCFTTWGTQLFWLMEYRVAWKTIFVVDPVYTMPFIVVLMFILFKDKLSGIRRKLNYIVLVFTSLYLSFTVFNKFAVHTKFVEMTQADSLRVLNIDSRPAPLQNILWTANVETENHFWIYYFSWLDNKYQKTYSVKKNHELLVPFLGDVQVKKLIKISEGYYTVKKSGDDLIFNDLRFGQTLGWKDPGSPFVFAYKITSKNGVVKIVEVEKDYRNAGEMIPKLIARIKGEF